MEVVRKRLFYIQYERLHFKLWVKLKKKQSKKKKNDLYDIKEKDEVEDVDGIKHTDTNLKSGMPLAVLIPAPATTTTFWQRPSFTSRATEVRPPRDDGLAASAEGLPWLDLEPEDWQVCTGARLPLDIFALLESRPRKDTY